MRCYKALHSNRARVIIKSVDTMEGVCHGTRRIYSWRITVRDPVTNNLRTYKRSNEFFDWWLDCYKDASAYRKAHPETANDNVEFLEETICNCGRVVMENVEQVFVRCE